MARRKRKGRRRTKAALPMLVLAPSAWVIARDIKDGGGPVAIANRIVEDFTGYNMDNGGYNFDQVKPVLYGTIAGVIGHKVATKVGINRRLKKLTGGWIVL